MNVYGTNKCPDCEKPSIAGVKCDECRIASIPVDTEPTHLEIMGKLEEKVKDLERRMNQLNEILNSDCMFTNYEEVDKMRELSNIQ